MNIVCATDDNFVQHCSIMLVSLLENNKNVSIYILTEGLKENNKRIIIDEVSKYNADLNFCLVNSEIVKQFPMPDQKGLSHISRATYYRLFIAELLPASISKAIYLDCDIIINGSLEDLWNTDLSDYALAASLQIGHGFEALRLGYPIKYGYFNAGMNVINLDYFRKHNLSHKLIKYIINNTNKIKFHDQDALNGVLYDKTLHVLPQWNMISLFYIGSLKRYGDRIEGKLINDYNLEKKNGKKFKDKPIVLHYVSKPKPWNKRCWHPKYDLYYVYAKRTRHFNNLKKDSYIERLPWILKYFLKVKLSSIKQFFVRKDPTR